MFPIVLILIIYYFILIWKVLKHSYFIFKEKFQDKQRIYAILITVFIVIITGLFPYGIIPYQKLEQNYLVVVSLESAANCTTTLYFKNNNKFIEKTVCFGMFEYTGEYTMKGDTIFPITIKDNSIFERFKFGIISGDYLLLYKNENDAVPYPMKKNKK